MTTRTPTGGPWKQAITPTDYSDSLPHTTERKPFSCMFRALACILCVELCVLMLTASNQFLLVYPSLESKCSPKSPLFPEIQPFDSSRLRPPHLPTLFTWPFKICLHRRIIDIDDRFLGFRQTFVDQKLCRPRTSGRLGLQWGSFSPNFVPRSTEIQQNQTQTTKLRENNDRTNFDKDLTKIIFVPAWFLSLKWRSPLCL